MLDIVRRLLTRKRRKLENTRELRAAFKNRYRRFNSLLRANNEFLELIADIEEHVKGRQPFGMTFVRDRSMRACDSVAEIVDNMTSLAPGKYDALHDRFVEIQSEIDLHIKSPNRYADGPLALSLDKIDKELSGQVGAKMANLGEIRNKTGLKVPDGFVMTVAAHRRFMAHDRLQERIDAAIRSTNLDERDELYALNTALQHLIVSADVPRDLEEAILEHHESLTRTEGENLRVAVRSSALGEDLLGSTFAGAYRSVLNVKRVNLLDAYKQVVASKYNLPAVTYRLKLGVPDEDIDICVGYMSMIDAVSGGVLYSRNPINIRDNSVVISSMWGLPKSVVDGKADPDNFMISRGKTLQITRKRIPPKRLGYICDPDEGVRRLEVSNEQGKAASITDEQALELARIAVRLEKYYQAPQDIEWCIDGEQSIIILQCRPLKQIGFSRKRSPARRREPEHGTVILEGGVTASPGAATGPVFFVRGDIDLVEFPEGAVLIADQAHPRWATALDRAVAVVTEHGGMAGHLATVARELNLPALFSVKGAAEALSSGQVITVDADGMRIYEGSVFEFSEKEENAGNLMEGSSVYEALKGAAEHIVRLNLLDPDALSFRPEKCKTLHDITRFCHEKSVREMFDFGNKHGVPECSSKQLVAGTPMRWWVLNLDDGFKEEVGGKYVDIDNIRSIPMLALWEGITAAPWEGPPPVDGKGLLSVMFEATRNTDLILGSSSVYTERNYFMISKNYCSLNSRFGFHFANAEAMIGDVAGENYISFQFKGGAADHERRQKRVFFVREILQNHRFRVDVKEDNLIARLENYDKDFMIRSLKIIGYLAIHTRQLDMIMANPELVNHYMTKICDDIQKLFV